MFAAVKQWKTALVATVVIAAAPAAVSAQMVMLGGRANGLQEVPPVTTAPATGTTSLFYNRASGMITVTASFAGLTSTTTGVGPGNAPAHIHLAPPGVNGPIVIPLIGVPTGVMAVTSYSNSFSFAQLLGFGVSAANVTALETQLNGLVGAPVGTAAGLYLNVHTVSFPGGEIRADLAVVPEPGTYALVATGIAGLGLVARRRRQRA